MIVEVKAVETIAPVHAKQILTYLKISGKHLGLLINFDVERIKSGIKRIVNCLPEEGDRLEPPRVANIELSS